MIGYKDSFKLNNKDKKHNNNQPLVSVIIPTYNREKKVIHSINSVINQTYNNWELIIIDDKSTDNTRIILDDIIKKDARITYIYNQGKKGLPAARNCGIQNSCGKYIAFLDSDDIWINHHLENSIKVLEENNKEVCFALWYEVINGIKKPIEELEKKRFERGFEKFKTNTINNVIFFTNKNFYEHLFRENFYCYHINTMVIRKSIINKDMIFNENLKSNEDIDFTFKLIMKYGFCLIKEYHFEYHYCKDSLYAFVDRRKLDIESLLENVLYLDKIIQHSKFKIIYYKSRKKHIKRFHFIKDKKKWLIYFNQRIAKKFFTIGFLRIKVNRAAGLYYCLKSLLYYFNYDVLKYLIRSLITSKVYSVQIENELFDFN